MNFPSFPALSKPIMSTRERLRYTMADIVAAADPRGRVSNQVTEISDTIARESGHHPSGVLIAPEVFYGVNPETGLVASGARTLLAGNATDGGFTIGGEVMPWIEHLRPASAALRLGASMIGNLYGISGNQPSPHGDIAIPYESSSDEGEWLDETTAPTDGSHDSAFSSAVAKPKRITSTRTVSTQLLVQTPAMEQRLRGVVLGPVGRALDRGVLAGTGGVQTIGLLQMASDSGITVVSHGTDGGAGSYPLLIDAEAGPIAANCGLLTGGYAVSPNVREYFKRTPQFANTSIGCLQTVGGRDYLAGYPCIATSHMPDDFTKGSGTALGSFVFADWQYITIVIWGTPEVIVDKYSLAASGQIVITVNVFADVLHPVPGAIAIAKDVITT